MSLCSHQRGATASMQPMHGCQSCAGTTEWLKAFHPNPTLSSNQRGLKCSSLSVESLFHPCVERAKHSGPGSVNHLTGAAQHGSVMVPMAGLSFFSIPFHLCKVSSMHGVDQPYICVFPLRLLWGKGADFCSPKVILGKRLQTVFTSLSLQWKDAQIPWR